MNAATQLPLEITDTRPTTADALAEARLLENLLANRIAGDGGILAVIDDVTCRLDAWDQPRVREELRDVEAAVETLCGLAKRLRQAVERAEALPVVCGECGYELVGGKCEVCQ